MSASFIWLIMWAFLVAVDMVTGEILEAKGDS